MKHIKTKESGFTLIEAMVAFLIVVVGLAGAALFQSELIGESGASKARAIAVALAEKELEERRALLTQAEYDTLDTIVAAATPQEHNVTVGNADYKVSFTATSTAAAATEDYYQLAVAVNWKDAKGNSDTVVLNTFMSQNLPESSLDNSEQAGVGSNPNTGLITRPTGSAEAIARVTTEQTRTATAIGDYTLLDANERTYGIKTEETTCDSGSGDCENIVSVVKLTGADNQIFKISGDIFFFDSPDNDFTSIKASPNVLTSEGGGCAVYEFNSQASYTCLFGEGWYGTISLVLPLENSGKPADSVCLSPRSYKYYRIDPDAVTNNSNTIDSTTVIGQSGLLRFTDSTGNGPYLATSNAAPAFGYYFVTDKLDNTRTGDVTDAGNTSGNINDQHFVVADDVGNDWADTFDNCIDSGGRITEPLVEESDSYPGYPSLTQDNYSYTYTPASGPDITVVIPDDNIILGYGRINRHKKKSHIKQPCTNPD
jgi:Tfp pilus assembly protein PilV